MRLALGTVQFGRSYGVANAGGQVAPQAVSAILERARSNGVDTLDTAVAYGSAEEVLGGCGVVGWRVVTKLPPLPAGVSDVGSWVEQEIRGSLGRLRIERLDALLLHSPADLWGPHRDAYVKALARAKDAGLTGAVGVSVYSPEDLEKVWPVLRPDLVQAPFNVVDRRLLVSGWLERLRAAGVRVHTRSVFLQGLLLMSGDKRPAFFRRWAAQLDAWIAWCKASGCSALSAALGFVMAQPAIERVVVGVDSLDHLDGILQALRERAPLPPVTLGSDDLELIEPSRWKVA